MNVVNFFNKNKVSIPTVETIPRDNFSSSTGNCNGFAEFTLIELTLSGDSNSYTFDEFYQDIFISGFDSPSIGLFYNLSIVIECVDDSYHTIQNPQYLTYEYINSQYYKDNINIDSIKAIFIKCNERFKITAPAAIRKIYITLPINWEIYGYDYETGQMVQPFSGCMYITPINSISKYKITPNNYELLENFNYSLKFTFEDLYYLQNNNSFQFLSNENDIYQFRYRMRRGTNIVLYTKFQLLNLPASRYVLEVFDQNFTVSRKSEDITKWQNTGPGVGQMMTFSNVADVPFLSYRNDLNYSSHQTFKMRVIDKQLNKATALKDVIIYVSRQDI